MGSTRRCSPDPIRASGFACPAQTTWSPWYLASAVVFSSRHPHPHSFAPHPAMSGDGYALHTIQELLGHKDVKTTMIYTHVHNRRGLGVRSPVDALYGLGRRFRRKPSIIPPAPVSYGNYGTRQAPRRCSAGVLG